jgi:hypothetical protein
MDQRAIPLDWNYPLYVIKTIHSLFDNCEYQKVGLYSKKRLKMVSIYPFIA